MGIQSTIGLGGLFESLEKRFLLHHKKRGKGQIEVKLCNTCFKRENKNKQKKIQKKKENTQRLNTHRHNAALYETRFSKKCLFWNIKSIVCLNSNYRFTN